LLDRPRSGRPPKVTGELEQHLNRLIDQDPWSTALSIPNGVVANWPPCWPTRPGSNSAVKVCAGC
jgi:hypothetical protein